mmetsp:Transcript_113410/g.242023  ORF Transcript_113410/g.242023 Transcript_113410/m.242023 type:complete len:202 (+) Transcript_113410:58-663(+)
MGRQPPPEHNSSMLGLDPRRLLGDFVPVVGHLVLFRPVLLPVGRQFGLAARRRSGGPWLPAPGFWPGGEDLTAFGRGGLSDRLLHTLDAATESCWRSLATLGRPLRRRNRTGLRSWLHRSLSLASSILLLVAIFAASFRPFARGLADPLATLDRACGLGGADRDPDNGALALAGGFPNGRRRSGLAGASRCDAALALRRAL